MPLENLGPDLVLTVGGDLAPVQATLQQLPDIGKQTANDLDAALSGVNAGAQLEDQMRSLGDAVRASGDAAQQTRPRLEDLGSQAKDTGDKSEGASKQVDLLSASLNSIGFGSLVAGVSAAELLVDAIEHIVTAVADLVSSAIEAFATLQKFQVSMTLLTGSTDAAQAAVQRLANLAASSPFSFDELARAQQRMQAFGISTSESTTVMRAAMDAAAATGNSFNVISNALERVEVTGSITARQLNQLGVSWEDLAKAAGTSVAEIQDTVKKGGQSAEADLDLLVKAIETKFGGAAEAAAQTISGQFQIIKNQLTLLGASFGGDLAPAILDLANVFETDLLPALQNVASAFKPLMEAMSGPFGVAVHAAGDTIAWLINEFASAVHTLADFIAAVNHAIDTIPGMRTALNLVGQALQALELAMSVGSQGYLNISATGANAALVQDRMRLTTEALTKQFGAHVSETGQMVLAQQQLNDNLDQAKKHLADVQAAMASGKDVRAEYAQAIDAVNKAEKDADPIGYAAKQAAAAQSMREQSQAAQELVKQAQQAAASVIKLDDDVSGVGKSWDALNAAEQRGADLVKPLEGVVKQLEADLSTAKDHLGSMNAGEQQLYAQAQQLLASYQAWLAATKDTDATLKDMETHANAQVKGVLQLQQDWQTVKKVTDEVGLSMKDFATRQTEVNKLIEQAGYDYKTNQNDLALIDQELANIGAHTKTAADYAIAMDPAWQKVIKDAGFNVDQLTAIQSKMTAANATLGDQAAVIEKILLAKAREGEYYDSEYYSLQKINLQLAEEQTSQQLLLSQVNILADAWNGMMKAFTTAFTSMSQGFAQAIVEGKSFGDAMHTVLTKLAEDILQVVIEGALKQLYAWLSDNFDALGKLSTGFNTVFGAGGQMQKDLQATAAAAASAAQQATQAAQQTAQAAESMAQNVGQSSSSAIGNIQQVGASALNIVNTISGVVSAIGSMMSAVELKHTNTLLSRIEESTRFAKRYLGEMSDGIYETLHDIKDLLTLMEKDLQTIDSSVKNIQSVAPSTTQATAALPSGTTFVAPVADYSGLATAVNTTTAALTAMPPALFDYTQAVSSASTATNAQITAVTGSTAAIGTNTTALNSATQAATDMQTAMQNASFATQQASTNAQGTLGSILQGLTGGTATTLQNAPAGSGNYFVPAQSAAEQANLIANLNSDPMSQAAQVIEQAMSGVQNETVRWGLVNATLQALATGDLPSATQALQTAGLNLTQAAAVIQQAAPQPAPPPSGPVPSIADLQVASPTPSGAPDYASDYVRSQIAQSITGPINQAMDPFNALLREATQALSGADVSTASQLASQAESMVAKLPTAEQIQSAQDMANLIRFGGGGDAVHPYGVSIPTVSSPAADVSNLMQNIAAEQQTIQQDLAYQAAHPPGSPGGPPLQLNTPFGSFGNVTTDQMNQLNDVIGKLGLTSDQANEALGGFLQQGKNLTDAIAGLNDAYQNTDAAFQARIAEQQKQQQAEQAAAESFRTLTVWTASATYQVNRFNNGISDLTSATENNVAVIDEQQRLLQTALSSPAMIANLNAIQISPQDAQKNLLQFGNEAGNGTTNPATLAATQFLAYQQSLAALTGPIAPSINAANLSPGTSITVAPVINAQGAMFGQGGVQQLATTIGNTIVDNLRRAGLKF